LAVLDYTVNYRRRGWVPATVVGLAMIPASARVATVSIDKLPANRFIASPPPELQVLGGDWLERGTTAVLKVPSVIVTEEWNYPLNPLHADFLKLRISAPPSLCKPLGPPWCIADASLASASLIQLLARR
jgi:RES domain-containing protein